MIGQRVIRAARGARDFCGVIPSTDADGPQEAVFIHIAGDSPVVMCLNEPGRGRVEVVGWSELTFCNPEAVEASLNPGDELSGDGEVTLER